MATSMDDYVDWDFVKSIFSPADLTKNIRTSPRKQTFVLVVTSICVVISLVLVRQGDKVVAGLIAYFENTILALAIVYCSVEPIFLIIQSLILAHPAVDPENDQPESTDDIAVVIACHRSSDVVVRTVHACLKHLRPNQIFVMDNANFPDPPDNTREVLEESDLHEVNYIYNPYGNKTMAMYAGSVAAKDFKYLLLIDDDVTLPENMHFGKHLFSETVKAVCYPIQAVHPDTEECTSIFVEWQAIEYKMSDYSKMLQNEFSTVLFPHGAICLWDRSTLIQCFRAHDTVFYADDVKMGMWFQLNNHEMKLHSRTIVKTDAPTTVVGPYPNYYNQRVRSWDMAEHVYASDFLKLLLFTRHRTWLGFFVLKWFQFYACYSIVADWLRIPVIALSMWVNWTFFTSISISFIALYTGLLILWDSIGFRKCPERQSRFFALVTFQAYKLPAVLIRLLGMIRAFTVYIPNYQRKPTIPELEESVLRAHDPTNLPKKPVWMDRSNPYYEHYRPSNPAAIHRPISPLGIPAELETIHEMDFDFESGADTGTKPSSPGRDSPPPDIVPKVQPPTLLDERNILVVPGKLPPGMGKLPEYIPRQIITQKHLRMGILQDDASALSLPSAVQSIREQLSGELTREEAAKRRDYRQKKESDLAPQTTNNRYVVAPEDSGLYDDDIALGVGSGSADLTEDITESNNTADTPMPSPIQANSPPLRPLPTQQIRYNAIQ